jgi:uncharacterized Zn-binding protein involved in type VI secretion
MSTLNVANITDGTDTVATGYVVNGSAKAWVKFDGTGTAAISDSLNVASLTDNGTGHFTVNMSSSMLNGNYSLAGSAGHTTAVTNALTGLRPAAVFTSSACTFNTLYVNASAASTSDYSQTSSTIHGDLA